MNPLSLKLISWQQPYPGIEQVAHFPMSPLTLRPLHGSQTSQCPSAPAFDPVSDIHESHGGVAGGVRTVDLPNLPDNSSSNRRRENYP